MAAFYDHLVDSPKIAELKTLLNLSETSKLLDVAGGTGRVSRHFLADTNEIIVCDSAPRMIQQARSNGLQAVQGTAESLPFPDEAFDRILMVDAFHHVNNQQVAVGEMLRVLKPGGRLVMEEPDIRRVIVKFVGLIEKLMLMRSNFYAPERIVAMLINAGVTARIERAGKFRVWITADKSL